MEEEFMYRNVLLMLSLIASIIFVSIFVAPVFAEQKAENINEAKEIRQHEGTYLAFADVWARESMSSNGNSAIYMKISNPTDKPINIIGASTPMVAGNVELHESFVDEQGVSRMTSIDKIVVPANSEIELKPGAIHIMLLDLRRTLTPGDKFTMDVNIENMAPVAVEVIVKK
jgi:hypothetical protein